MRALFLCSFAMLASACAMPLQQLSESIQNQTLSLAELHRRAPSYSRQELSCLLSSAVKAGSREMALALLARGAQPSGISYDVYEDPEEKTYALRVLGCSESPLHIAVANNDEPMVGLLLEKGARPDGLLRYRDRPFGDAVPALVLAVCERGQQGIVKLLLSHGADVNQPWPGGRTPLYAAAGCEAEESTALLLAHGARVDLTYSERGWRTPLHSAAERGYRPRLVRMLIQAGADVNAMDRDGATPLNLARDSEEIRQILIASGARETDPQVVEENARERIEKARREREEAARQREAMEARRSEEERRSREAIYRGLAEAAEEMPKFPSSPSFVPSMPPPVPAERVESRGVVRERREVAPVRQPEPVREPPKKSAPSERDCASTVTPETLPIENEMTRRQIGTARAQMPATRHLSSVCLVGSVDGKVRRYQYRCSLGKWVFVQRFQIKPDNAEDCIPAEFSFTH